MTMDIEKTPIREHLLLLSSIFPWQNGEPERLCTSGKYEDWWDGLADGSRSFFRNNYYPTYGNVILSGAFLDKDKRNRSRADMNFRHLRSTDIKDFENLQLFFDDGRAAIPFSITRVDLYFFKDHVCYGKPERIGIFAFRVKLVSKTVTATLISDFISSFRVVSGGKRLLRDTNNDFTVMEWLEQRLLMRHITGTYIDIFSGSKLKTYLVIDYATMPSDVDHLLLDVGTVSPISTSKGGKLHSLSVGYYKELLAHHCIATHDNWKALILLDTFTVVTTGWEKIWLENTWAETYFNIYVHCLHLKYVLLKTNTELADISGELKKNSQSVRNEFIKFINTHNLSSISYNFLPNVLHTRIKLGMEIVEEISSIDEKLNRSNDLLDDRGRKRIQFILVILAFLGILSVLNDATEYLKGLLRASKDSYIFISGGVLFFLLIFMAIVVILMVRQEKKQNR